MIKYMVVVRVWTENASALPRETIEAILASPFNVVAGSGELTTSSETTISAVIEAETPEAAGFQAVTQLSQLGIVRLEGVQVHAGVARVEAVGADPSE